MKQHNKVKRLKARIENYERIINDKNTMNPQAFNKPGSMEKS